MDLVVPVCACEWFLQDHIFFNIFPDFAIFTSITKAIFIH